MKKKAFSVIVLMLFMLVMTPTTIYGSTGSYTTDTSMTSYGVVTNGSLQSATTTQRNAISAMREKALFSWSGPESNYEYHPKYSNGSPVGDTILLSSGSYRGILYQQKAYSASAPTHSGTREKWHSSAESVQNAVNEMIQYNQDSVKGTDCSSSASYAWRQALGATSQTNGILMVPSSRDSSGKYRSAYTSQRLVQDGNHTSSGSGYGNYVTRVGQYGQYASEVENKKNTYNIINGLMSPGNYSGGADIYLRVYDKMQAGDFLVTYRNSNKHVRLIEKVFISKSDGVVDPDASYVIVTEQGSSLWTCTNAEFNSTYQTTWRTCYGEGDGTGEVKYTFRNLATTGYYLPYRYNGSVTTNVSGFVVTNITDSSIAFRWNTIEENCHGYELQYSTSPDFKDSKTIVYDNNSICEDEINGLEEKDVYYARMRSYCIRDDGTTEYSGFNDWLKIDIKTGDLYRENSPELDGTEESQKVYDAYVYNDEGYDFADDGIEDIEAE